MQRPFILASIALLFIAATVLNIMFMQGDAKQQTLALLKLAGFPDATILRANEADGAFIFEDVKLDPSGFNTIDTITVTQNWRKALETITVDNIRLTGDMDDTLDVTIAEWRPSDKNLKTLIKRLPKGFALNDAKLSLLTPELDGIDLTLDLQARPQKDGHEIQLSFRADHPKLSFDARGQGALFSSGFWQGNIKLEEGKFELGAVKTSRMNGELQASGQGFESSDMAGELQAGALTLLNLPWQNATIGISGPIHAPSANIAARSAGIEGLELGLEFQDITSPQTYMLVIHADTLGALFDILAARNGLPLDEKALAPIAPQANYDFVIAAAPHNVSFEIYRENEPVIINGSISTQEEAIPMSSILTGQAFGLSLQTDKGTLQGALRYDTEKNRLRLLPEEKILSPKLKKDSQMIDIFQ